MQPDGTPAGRTLLSIVTPGYNEAKNLPLLYERLCRVLGALDLDWEWIVVDDHSVDRTFAVVADIARRDARVRGVRLARNSGSHVGLTCGLHHARGHCAAVMAADLQDPPETLPALLDQWRQGVQVVWAARAGREGETFTTRCFARLYYALMRHGAGIRDMPATGADFFLIDRRVAEAVRQFPEHNVSILALITWMGFRQTTVSYTKQARLHGRSGWTLRKKLKLLVDSVTSFSYVPIRMMSYVGSIVALVGFVYTLVVLGNGLAGRTPVGWAALMAVVLVLGGIQMLMLGLLGEYVWRALDESRRRPRYLIEEMTPDCHVVTNQAERQASVNSAIGFGPAAGAPPPRTAA
jgi:dolichol-phosphate mannosyltransferase